MSPHVYGAVVHLRSPVDGETTVALVIFKTSAAALKTFFTAVTGASRCAAGLPHVGLPEASAGLTLMRLNLWIEFLIAFY